MERRTFALLAAGAVLSAAVCGGFAWFAWNVLSTLGGGDGLEYIEDPRPAHAAMLVADDAGSPLAGATVEAFLEPPFWGDFETKFGFDPASEPKANLTTATGPDGRAAFDGLVLGDWVVAVRSPGRAASFARARGGHAGRLDLRFQLGIARSLGGRVSDGDPVAGAVVLACETSDRHFREGHWLASVRARTGPRGEFRLGDLPSGVVSLWVVRPGDVPVEAGRVLVPTCADLDVPVPSRRVAAVIRPASDREPARSSPTAPDATQRVSVRGHVVSADGTPIDGAYVSALHHGEYGEEEFGWTSSGPDGAFSLEGVPAEARLALRISAREHLPITTSWDDAEDIDGTAVHRLERSARIVGRVTTRDGAAPRDLRVWIYRLGQDEQSASHGLSVLWAGCPTWWWKAAPSPAGADGRFETSWDWDPGRLVAYASADGYAPTVSAPFDVGAGRGPARVDIVLDPGATLRCRLLGPDGLPVTSRPVRIRPPGFVGVWGATAAATDAEGRFAIEHLPARPVIVDVGSHRTREYRSVTVTPGPDEIEVRLTKRVRSDGEDDDR